MRRALNWLGLALLLGVIAVTMLEAREALAGGMSTGTGGMRSGTPITGVAISPSQITVGTGGPVLTNSSGSLSIAGGWVTSNSSQLAAGANLTVSGGDVSMGTGSDLKFEGTGGDGRIQWGNQTETGADTGDANPRAMTVQPISNFIAVTCNDVNTCDVTMSETGAYHGAMTCFVNVSTNSVDIDEAAGVTALAADPVALGQYDSVCLVYVTDIWVQVGATGNN